MCRGCRMDPVDLRNFRTRQGALPPEYGEVDTPHRKKGRGNKHCPKQKGKKSHVFTYAYADWSHLTYARVGGKYVQADKYTTYYTATCDFCGKNKWGHRKTLTNDIVPRGTKIRLAPEE